MSPCITSINKKSAPAKKDVWQAAPEESIIDTEVFLEAAPQPGKYLIIVSILPKERVIVLTVDQ